jgi:hypothetical protein
MSATVVRPEWVEHQKRAGITSLDVHMPTGRLATAGNDACVRMWSLRSALDDVTVTELAQAAQADHHHQ